jgi:transcriptional regulator with XRE-family HTH domain
VADASATERTREQGKRIRLLREHLRIPKSVLCAELGFSSTQSLDLYERGISAIRVDRADAWAEAFKMSREDFLATLLGNLKPWQPWTFRSALRGRIPESLIERYAPTWEGRPLINQQAAVEAILEMAEEIRDENTPKSAKSHTA